jgi:V/A-type H+/Na+-transporting ATPase subunit C
MYEYPTGLIRVLEKQLLDKNNIERMTLSKNAHEAFSVLHDTDYKHTMGTHSKEDYDKVLEEDTRNLRALMHTIIYDTPLYEFLFIENDFLLGKYILKNLFFGSSEESPPLCIGVEDPERIRTFITTSLTRIKEDPNNQFEIPEREALLEHNYIAEALYTVTAKVHNKKDGLAPRDIDRYMDFELFRIKRALSKKIKSRFVHDFLKLHIDFLNTKVLLRFAEESQFNNWSLNERHFLHGGRFTPDDLIQLYQSDKHILFTNLRELFEVYALEEAIDTCRDDGSIERLEYELDKRLHDFAMTRAKSSSYGAAVVMGYYLAKMNSVRNISIIMSGKLNGVSTEKIKERII